MAYGSFYYVCNHHILIFVFFKVRQIQLGMGLQGGWVDFWWCVYGYVFLIGGEVPFHGKVVRNLMWFFPLLSPNTLMPLLQPRKPYGCNKYLRICVFLKMAWCVFIVIINHALNSLKFFVFIIDQSTLNYNSTSCWKMLISKNSNFILCQLKLCWLVFISKLCLSPTCTLLSSYGSHFITFIAKGEVLLNFLSTPHICLKGSVGTWC